LTGGNGGDEWTLGFLFGAGAGAGGDDGWRRSDFSRSWEGLGGARVPFSSADNDPSRSSRILLKHSSIRLSRIDLSD
jgi:hypothetical protein